MQLVVSPFPHAAPRPDAHGRSAALPLLPDAPSSQVADTAAGGKPLARQPASPRPVALPPEQLHPALWRGHQLGAAHERTVPSGFAALDAHLPGGGWPRRALTELLLAQPGIGEIRLLAHSLAQVQQAGRLVMLFDPPARLSAWALMQLGLDVAQLLVVHTREQPRPDTDTLWALEQSLKSGNVGATLAWLPPRLRPERVRRLQLAAQAHDGPAFVLRETAAQQQASAAPLRLALRAGGADQLAISVLKRRGPPLLAPIHLRLPAVLSATAQARAQSAAQAAASHEALGGAVFINLA